jgi:hypothetical protein
MPAMLNRRHAFTGLGLTFGATMLGQGAVAQVPAWAPTALTRDQARALDAAAEVIIPATDTPGARAAGVTQFIDRAVGGWCDKAQAGLLRDGLDGMDLDARARHGVAFADLNPTQQSAILTAYEQTGAAQRPFFVLLRELTTIGYFTSKPGATVALRYDPVPGPYRGCVPLKDIGRAWAT